MGGLSLPFAVANSPLDVPINEDLAEAGVHHPADQEAVVAPHCLKTLWEKVGGWVGGWVNWIGCWVWVRRENGLCVQVGGWVGGLIVTLVSILSYFSGLVQSSPA